MMMMIVELVVNMMMMLMEKIKIEHNIDDITISKMDLILRVRLCHLDSDDDASHVGKESWQPDHPLVIGIVVIVVDGGEHQDEHQDSNQVIKTFNINSILMIMSMSIIRPTPDQPRPTKTCYHSSKSIFSCILDFTLDLIIPLNSTLDLIITCCHSSASIVSCIHLLIVGSRNAKQMFATTSAPGNKSMTCG